MRQGRFGWSGGVSEFLTVTSGDVMQALEDHHDRCMGQQASASQREAWGAFISGFKLQCAGLATAMPRANHWTIVLEFELPRERGRRPDLVLLADQSVYAVEFKNTANLKQAHVDQVLAYARDLKHYHTASHALEVVPILVTSGARLTNERDGVWVCGLDGLAALLEQVHAPATDQIDGCAWVEADYAPLPSLVDAARRIFDHEELPQIRRASSAGVGDAVQELLRLSTAAKERREHHLVLVTGVPGAGKTLVGLQFVYAQQFSQAGTERNSVFLSGNHPLVTVLQHALKSCVFVRDVHGFLKEHGGKHGSVPREQIWVYDEAQRAWDRDRVREKRDGGSEPEDFLYIGRRHDWALMVGLIGEGQEIHIGEEAGLTQWNEAIENVGGNWIVHCPRKVSEVFAAASAVIPNDALDLTVSLRSHLAEDVQAWVSRLLRGEIEQAASLSDRIREQGFQIYVSRDLEQLKAYVVERYEGMPDKRYGLLASSRDRCLPSHGVRNDYNWTKNMKFGPWYNDAPGSKYSCCQLADVATEFACQGLELDFPVIAWGDDFYWHQDGWRSKPQPRSKAHDPHRLRVNSYRVLLTRGRDGFAIFVPDRTSLDATCDVLCRAGARLAQNNRSKAQVSYRHPEAGM